VNRFSSVDCRFLSRNPLQKYLTSPWFCRHTT